MKRHLITTGIVTILIATAAYPPAFVLLLVGVCYYFVYQAVVAWQESKD